MKKRMTRHELREYARTIKLPIIQIGYCGAAHLLRGLEPFAYNAGVYGWNWDAYRLERCIICTGYRNLIGDAADPDLIHAYEIVHAYEQRAAELDYWGDEYRSKLSELRQEFQAALLNH